MKRFWDKVDKSGDCWLWTGCQDGHGYGQLSTGWKKPPIKAHRQSWIIHNGPIPEGMQVNHHCDTRLCVRPDHLYLGTQLDNIRDCSKRGRRNPKSDLNLRPGAPGYHGAGPISAGELDGITQ